MKKALVLYSGGLDSRLVIKILQEQNFEVTALKFILPFGCSDCSILSDPKEIKLIEFNVKEEPLLSEYLSLLKDPKHGTGAGINSCKDCKVFMLKKAKEYADENNIPIIATGEVLGQRPMSQVSSAMKTINEQIDFEVLRPLSAKALPKTSVEKSGLINREKLYGIIGRGRKKQIALAEKYNLKFPTPGGGCFLCEKNPAKRLQFLLEKNLITSSTLKLTTIGRHFFIDKTWFVVARNFSESQIITSFQKYHLKDDYGKPSVYFNSQSGKKTALKLQIAFSTGDNQELRNKFKEHKI